MELISRQNILDAIKKLESYTWLDKPTKDRPKGRWEKIIPPRKKTFDTDYVYCTNCQTNKPKYYREYKYCPDCGAEMDTE